MNDKNQKAPVRVLVVDDSALNREQLARLIEDTGEAEVVGEAADGEEALKLVFSLKPDAITLDLEMPKMNGFTFLRILMSKQPAPVIVVSRHSEKENIFKALEFGAIDFVEKPSRWTAAESAELRAQLRDKILLVRSLRAQTTTMRPLVTLQHVSGRPAAMAQIKTVPRMPPRVVIAIASSAGGPAALLDIFSRLPARFPAAVLVAQHMPERFTRTFAQRLDSRTTLLVSEARDRDPVLAHRAYVCPGDRCMEVELGADGVDLLVRVVAPSEKDRYVPSADRLFRTVAHAAGPRAVGVVLTGMGDDGTEGALAIRRARGIVVAESKESAVVPGMPVAAVRAGAVTKVLDLAEIANYLAEIAH